MRALLFVAICVLVVLEGVQTQCPGSCLAGGSCPCLNGGECQVTGSSCLCAEGWAGTQCSVALCQPPNLCGAGTCVAPPNVCDCGNTGWTGANCSQGICTSPCLNGGQCTGPESCTCPYGFVGARCEIPNCIPVCSAGSCVAPDTCDCTGTGFTGDRCQEVTCEGLGCLHGGECIGPNLCSCVGTGYTGPHCEIAQCNPGCQSGGTCATPNVCDCSTANAGDGSWTGDLCEIPICDEVVCQNNGTCGGPNQCDCRFTGYTGLFCELDVDECLAAVKPCHPLTTCTNTVGGFTCSPCPPGYAGTGETNCTHTCTPACQWGASCISVDNCDCTGTGYEGPGCSQNIDECARGFCDPLVNCTDYPGTFECGDCPGNYTGDGRICDPICDPECDPGFFCSLPDVCEILPESAALSPLTLIHSNFPIMVALFAVLVFLSWENRLLS